MSAIVKDDPDVRLYFPQYLASVGMLLITGATTPPLGASEIQVDITSNDGVRTLVAGVSPFSRRIAGARGADLLYLEDGTFYALLDVPPLQIVTEVAISADFSPLRRRLAPQHVEWPDALVADFRDLQAHGVQSDAVRRLFDAEQMRVLALATWAWLKANPGQFAPVPDDVAIMIGEAARKAVLPVLTVPVLTAGLPRRLRPTESRRYYPERFDILCEALKFSKDAKRLIEEEVAINGANGWTHLNEGHVHWTAGDLAAADESYARAAALLAENDHRGSHTNDGVFTWRDKATADRTVGTYDPTPSLVSPPPDGRIVHLIACDDGYFQRFGNACITSSLDAGHNDVIVHVHVCNPSDSTIQTLRAWAARDDVIVRFTTEQREVVSKTLYTCLRYFQAQSVAKRYLRPLMITDADMVVNRPWREVRDELAAADAAFMSPAPVAWLTDRPAKPWAIPAGAVYFARTTAGMSFLTYTVRYIEALLTFPRERYWYRVWSLDQVALGRAFMSVLLPASAKVRNLRQVRFFRGPAMAAGGKDTLGSGAAPGPHEVARYE